MWFLCIQTCHSKHLDEIRGCGLGPNVAKIDRDNDISDQIYSLAKWASTSNFTSVSTWLLFNFLSTFIYSLRWRFTESYAVFYDHVHTWNPVQPVWFAPLELAEPCSVVVMTASVTVRPSLHCNYINYYVRNTNKCSKNFFVRMLKSSHIKKASARKPNKWARGLGLCLGSVVGGPMLRLCLAGDGDSQVRRHWYSPVAKRWSSNKFLLL